MLRRAAPTVLGLVVFLFASISPLPAEETVTEPQLNVEVRFRTSVIVHPRGENMTSVCRSDHAAGGCSEVSEAELECHCVQRDGGWFIITEPRVHALIHVPNTRDPLPALVHERRHIARMEESLGRHLAVIGSHDYESEETCQRLATFFRTSTHIRVILNAITEEEQRDCGRPHARHTK